MNMVSSARPRVALITGPTASGKSALALALAERHQGTIINADSAQVYADLRALSARPDDADLARAPHRLFGHVDGAASYSAAAWAADARAAIDEAQAAGRLPVLVGGTGLYLRTLLDGIAPVPEIDDAVRRAVRALPVADAYRQLEQADPDAAARLAPADTSRVARALEVVRATGRPLSAWQAARSGGIADAISLTALVLLPDRDWLFARCDQRLDAMLARGAADEVRALLARPDIPATAPVRRAIGVREIAGWLAGDYDAATALAAAKLATRRYAKRQYTWFRNQPPDSWQRTAETENNNLVELFERIFRQ